MDDQSCRAPPPDFTRCRYHSVVHVRVGKSLIIAAMEPPRQFNGFKENEPKFDNFNGFASDDHTTHRHLHSKTPQPAAFAPSYNNDFYQAPPIQQPSSSPYGPPTTNRPPSRQQHQQSFYDPNQFVTEPVVSMAKAYGGHFAEQSKQQIEKYISVNQLKYYFDVDNSYVGKKLGLIFFPFAHKEWSVKYNHDQQPLPPRHDVNAPDLYLPVMAIVTYILIAGTVLGTQERFTPEKLGMYASSALMWLICENILVLITKYVMNISQSLRTWDTLAFCGYKYVCMNVCLLTYLCSNDTIYYCVFAYCSLAIVIFLIRSVKGFVLENFQGTDGRKRKFYLLLIISLSQPFIIWWLTSSLTNFHTPPKFELPEDFEM